MKAMFFDFDGVIHDTFQFHRKKTKDFCGIDISEEDYRNVHRKNFFLNIPEDFKHINWEEYRDYIYEEQSNLKISSTINKTLLFLKKKYDLYIVTSGGTKNISDYFNNNKLPGLFKEIMGMESFRSKVDKFNYLFDKYKLEKKDVVFVTDTLGDLYEANSVELKTIAVDFGFHNREMLEEGNPHLIISSFDELKNI